MKRLYVRLRMSGEMVRVSLDDEAIQNLFVEKKDYVLQYALDYLQ